MKKTFALAMFCVIFILSSCTSTKNTQPISQTTYALDTVITIKIFDSDDNTIIDNCFALLSKYENLFSKTIKTSDVYKINIAKKDEPVQVDKETAYLIETALNFSKLTEGKFDITIKPVADLWDFTAEDATPPNEDDIVNALAYVGYKNIVVDGNLVTKSNSNTQIDLGAIAKGYIADKISEFLYENKVNSAIINLGGNIYVHGKKTSTEQWSVGIQSPFDMTDSEFKIIKVDSTSIVTSGVYERSFYYNNKLYHHLLDVKTGVPVENDIASVTIVSKSSTNCDALSTSCFLLGYEKSKLLLANFENTSAIFIFNDKSIKTIGEIDFAE